jgi:hypothetical protein
MAFTPIPIGSLAWGTPVNNAFVALDQMQGTSAPDHGLIAWSWDVATSLGASSLISGTVFMTKMWVRQPVTITNLIVSLVTLGSGLTAGQNFMGLYNAAGTRLGVTADQTTTWGSGTVGAQEIPLTVPAAVSAGPYWLAMLSNGTTPPVMGRGSSAASGGSTVNLKLTAATARYTTGPTVQTTLPASITMASRTLDARAFWTALS